MASSGDDAIEDAMNVLLSVTEKSGNLRNGLRKDILKAVSNLRTEFARLKSEAEDKNKLIVCLEMKVVETNSTLKGLQFGAGDNYRGDKGATSLGSQVTSKNIDWNVAHSADRTKKRYSDVVADSPGNVPFDNEMYKLFVKSKKIKVQYIPGPYLSQR
jgi:hypothetical protein